MAFFLPQSSTRRSFVSGAAKSILGVGMLPMLPKISRAGVRDATQGGTAKSVIYVYLNGGMSHIDSFDTKPGSETQGPVEALKTSADGVRVSQYFPQMAKQMHHVSVVNSLNSTAGAHAQGRYYMHTGYTLRGTVRHPDLGAWNSYHNGKRNPGLPANVRIGGSSDGSGAGFLESSHGALPIGSPTAGLQYSELPKGVDYDRFNRRMTRLKRMNKRFTDQYDTKQARAYAAMYDEAVKLMKSEDVKSFDLSLEEQSTRDRYGDNPLGQGCLLARRLVEKGVGFIEVNDGGWDTHDDNFGRLADKTAPLDQALSALLSDLEQRGLLKETLVVLATEFGRTPTIQTDRNNGRNHYPQAFSCLLAGGGVKGGYVHGKTDEEGREVIEDLVTVPDFNATIGHAMGLPLDKKVMSPSMRPFTVADKGEPVLKVFS